MNKSFFLYDSGNLAKFNVSELTEELKQKVLQDKNELIDIVIEQIENRFENHEMLQLQFL